MNIKKSVLAILGIILLTAGIAIGALLVQQNQNPNKDAAPATTAFISPTNSEIGQDKNFAIWVKMDSGTNGITGVDLKVNYDKNVVELTSLERGSSISNLENELEKNIYKDDGYLRYIAYTTDKTKAVSGSSVEVLRINGKVKSGATLGATTFSFDNATAASGTGETQNILVTKTPGTITVVTGNGANDLVTEGEPNSCGGTCGSNYNCKANFFCFEGYCRNPDCPSAISCGCSTPSVTTTLKPKTSTKATKSPEVVYYDNKSTTKPTITLPPQATATPVAENGLIDSGASTEKAKKAALWIGIGLGVIAIILGISSLFKKKDDDQTPPTTMMPPSTPASTMPQSSTEVNPPVANTPQNW